MNPEKKPRPPVDISDVASQESSPEESLEQRKERLEQLWSNWEIIKDNPELIALFKRKETSSLSREPSQILKEHGYPERTKIHELDFENWKVTLNPKFMFLKFQLIQ